jgi:hypothetical protein
MLGEEGCRQRGQRRILGTVGRDLALERRAAGNSQTIHGCAFEILPPAAASRRSASSRPAPVFAIRIAARTLLPGVHQQFARALIRYPAACAMIRRARSTSFVFFGWTFTIRFP